MNFSHDTELTLRAAGALVNSNRVHDTDDLADQRALDAYLREWGWTGRRDRDAQRGRRSKTPRLARRAPRRRPALAPSRSAAHVAPCNR